MVDLSVEVDGTVSIKELKDQPLAVLDTTGIGTHQALTIPPAKAELEEASSGHD